MMNRELLGPVRQIGYVVDDVERSAQTWVDRTGVGPWRVKPSVRFDTCFYRGRDIEVELAIASSYSNGLEIELIAQVGGDTSMYSDFVAAGGPGAQHICFYPSDYDTAHAMLVDGGLEVVLEGTIRGTKFAYLDDGLGQVIEIADVSAEGLAARVERTAVAMDWDGSEPFRS